MTENVFQNPEWWQENIKPRDFVKVVYTFHPTVKPRERLFEFTHIDGHVIHTIDDDDFSPNIAWIQDVLEVRHVDGTIWEGN